jgi:anaerobic ribonucleoside-triphosphate reductase activating protein
MKIGINKMHYPVTTLGYGRRVGIWVQGCTLHCSGCISKDTWEFDPVREAEVNVIAFALSSWLKMADGLTISGGEPFDQPQGLHELLRIVRPMMTGDILVFSGYSKSLLNSKYPEILAFVDVLIDGPFNPGAGQSMVLRGSDNQTINLLSETAALRYSTDINNLRWQGHRRMDVVVDEDTLWLAGIPELESMPRFREELVLRGFDCTTSDQFQPLVRA